MGGIIILTALSINFMFLKNLQLLISPLII